MKDKQAGKVETITPELAGTLLANNPINRPMNQNWISFLSGAMARGEWVVNDEAIKVAESGRLIDGQQRLTAFLRATETGLKSFDTWVIRGLPDSVFDSLDQGKKRTVSDTLSIRQEKSPG